MGLKHQVLARPCWRKPWPVKRVSPSSASPLQSLWKSSLASVLRVYGTCLSRPRSRHHASFSLMRRSVDEVLEISLENPLFAYTMLLFVILCFVRFGFWIYSGLCFKGHHYQYIIGYTTQYHILISWIKLMHFIIRWFPILVQLETFFVSRIDAVGRQRSAGFGQGWHGKMGKWMWMWHDGDWLRCPVNCPESGKTWGKFFLGMGMLSWPRHC